MNNEIIINKRKISESDKPFVIAELSANHNGNIERAKETILAAKNCGACAVKLQTYTPDTMTIKSNKKDFLITSGLWKGYSLYDLYTWAQTPFEWMRELFNYAREIDITIFSTPFDETAVDLLEDLNTPAYKVASFEATDLPLLKYIGSTKKPVIVSTGLANLEEIKEAHTTLMDSGCNNIAFLHCISSYPYLLTKLT